jgi:ParB family transcriptional regulator, chromosome partitioning protein
MSKAIAIVNEYRNLPLSQLQESPTNPRRRFDEHSLNELAASFAAQGVLQPLLVRAVTDDKYEVIAGARRLRAAKLAALKDVPVRIVALSDSDCVVAQLIENIQREGVHPMEEAIAFNALLRLESPRYDIATVAQKAGKSPAFVAQRQRLVELIPSIVEAFLADQIGVGHALEIAKLPQSQQEKAFDAAFRTVWHGGKDTRVTLPLRDFTAWIEQNILLSLDKVPFDKNDATLVPEAGSCADCPKRTGFNTLLFGEMGSQHDQCSDANCFNGKINRFVEKQVEAKPKLVQITTSHGIRGDGALLPRNRYVALQLTNPAKSKQPLSPYQKPCKHMAEAIVVDGAERGYSAKICAEPTCAVHFADRRTPDPTQLAKEREQRRKKLEKRKLEITIRHRTLAEVLTKVGAPLDRADLVLIANAMLDRTEPLRRETLARRHKMVDGSTSEVTYPQVQKGLVRLLRQLDESGLSKLIVEIVLLGSVESVSQDETDVLIATARRHRVDVAKLRATVVAEFATKQARVAAKQKKTVTKSTSKASKAA